MLVCCIVGKAKLWYSGTMPSFSFFQCAAAAAAAKSLQSCPTLWDHIDGIPTGSPIPGVLQARILEWVAISFSNAWKWKMKGKSLSHVQTLRNPMDCSLSGSSILCTNRVHLLTMQSEPDIRVTLVLYVLSHIPQFNWLNLIIDFLLKYHLPRKFSAILMTILAYLSTPMHP